MKNEKLKLIVFSAVFTALICAFSQVAIPIPSIGVSLTLQTFAVALCGYCLPEVYGVASVFVYIVLGLLGVPVFANFGAGPGVLFGFSGGFIVGFLPFALLCSVSLRIKNVIIKAVLGILGLICCHVLGAAWFSFASGSTFFKSVLVVSLPFLVKDIASVIFALLVSSKLNKYITKFR